MFPNAGYVASFYNMILSHTLPGYIVSSNLHILTFTQLWHTWTDSIITSHLDNYFLETKLANVSNKTCTSLSSRGPASDTISHLSLPGLETSATKSYGQDQNQRIGKEHSAQMPKTPNTNQ